MRTQNGKVVKIMAWACASVLIGVCLTAFLPVRGEENVYGGLVRLHILADSDDEDAQSVKYALRDYIVNDIAALTAGCADASQARVSIRAELPRLEQAANAYLDEIGCGMTAAVTLTREYYPTRLYEGEDSVRIPAGIYDSLRFIIGRGGGANWWCVLFPPICMGGARVDDELAAAGYSSEQIKILKPESGKKYEIRFKFLEIIGELFGKS